MQTIFLENLNELKFRIQIELKKVSIMVSKKEEQRVLYLERYRDIMLEIKERTLSIGELADGRTLLSPIFARELCFLQLRIVCECIALSCLIAHEDIQAIRTSKFQKEYSADLLIKMLDELHDDFYPVPIVIEHPKPGQVHLGEKTSDVLSKSELIRLVRFCGGKLHRGSIKNYTFRPSPNQLADDFRKILKWANQIIRLLEQHRINLSSGLEYLICYFSDENGNVGVAFAAAPEATQ